MGNSPLTVCIHQAWEKQTVQVVLPDGQVLFMPHPLTASMLMEAHPYHFVCQGSPSLLEQRLPLNTKLESGELYYLVPVPASDFTISSAVKPKGGERAQAGGGGGLAPRQAAAAAGVPSPGEKPAYKPSPPMVLDKNSSSFSRLNLKPQQCLINLFVFRQSVASVMPEESLKGAAAASVSPPSAQQAGAGGGQAAAVSVKNTNMINSYYHHSSQLLVASKQPQPQLQPHHQQQQPPRLESRQRSGTRGKRQIMAWKPQLESISETRPWHDFTTKNYYNDFSVSMISSIKALASSPTPIFPSSIFSPANVELTPDNRCSRGDQSPQRTSTSTPSIQSPIHPFSYPRGNQSPQRLSGTPTIQSPLHPNSYPRGTLSFQSSLSSYSYTRDPTSIQSASPLHPQCHSRDNQSLQSGSPLHPQSNPRGGQSIQSLLHHPQSHSRGSQAPQFPSNSMASMLSTIQSPVHPHSHARGDRVYPYSSSREDPPSPPKQQERQRQQQQQQRSDSSLTIQSTLHPISYSRGGGGQSPLHPHYAHSRGNQSPLHPNSSSYKTRSDNNSIFQMQRTSSSPYIQSPLHSSSYSSSCRGDQSPMRPISGSSSGHTPSMQSPLHDAHRHRFIYSA